MKTPTSAGPAVCLEGDGVVAKPGGRIAVALPARILLKQEDIPRRARETFLRLVEVTGIINGTNLSDTAVRPADGAAFMLLFARNQKPEAGHALQDHHTAV